MRVTQFQTYADYRIAMATAGVEFTSLAGYIEASPAELVRLFGPPSKGDEHKVSGEYRFKINDLFIRIYDWKRTTLYDVDLEISPDEFWSQEERVILNIGSQEGSDFQAVFLILEHIQNTRNKIKEG